MPLILVCDPHEFVLGVGGDFNAGSFRVRINRTELNFADRVLAHELGHAATHIRGLDDGTFGGHGPGWQQVMTEAGLGEEAVRMAQLTGQAPAQSWREYPRPNPSDAFVASDTNSRRRYRQQSQQPVQHCQTVGQHVGRFVDGYGRIFDRWQDVVLCNWR